MTTAYHAKYYSHSLSLQHPSASDERLAGSLLNAAVDLNPHQIDAALFALRSPLSNGVLLADEVGLGKTIEAGLVLCQLWAERKRRLLIICPASLRKQWALELEEKFNISVSILDGPSYRAAQRGGQPEPFDCGRVVIVSMNFASAMQSELRAVAWDLVVIDEAHKLRNAYRPTNRMGRRIRWAIDGRRKLLLTATPLQNSLLELYGLSTLIDEHIFGDRSAFLSQYAGQTFDHADLRARLRGFTKRTLRNEVLEYVRYTKRRAIRQSFAPTEEEQTLYEDVSAFLLRDDTYSIPERQRTLVTLVLRKLLASSSQALTGTLETMRARLATLLAQVEQDAPLSDTPSLLDQLVREQEVEDEYLDGQLVEDEPSLAADDGPDGEDAPDDSVTEATEETTSRAAPAIDKVKLTREIAELDGYIARASAIREDAKSRALLTALQTGFAEMERSGGARKAVIFTESRRTQEYLAAFLDANGYAGRIVTFSGTNSDAASTAIYEHWWAENRENGRATGSRAIDVRTALIEHFRDRAEVMIATEAAAEGINLQFCSLVVNYDLPWNPQRIEQRIGRCHRYGQEHDVVVLNFLNERNEADRRVLELLTEKFQLFDGVFGASDEVLGSIESGIDFERRILEIYQQCRTTEEIEVGFNALQAALDESIRSRLDETRAALLEHFDEDVHARLRMRLDGAREQLDRVSQMFWGLTRHVLAGRAHFDEAEATFDLKEPPEPRFRSGVYHLIRKDGQNIPGEYLYRPSHPLGEWAIETARVLQTPPSTVAFEVSQHPTHIADVERLEGQAGWLTLQLLTVDSFETEEYLLFSAITDSGAALDQETCEKLFRVAGSLEPAPEGLLPERLTQDAERHAAAALTRSFEQNNRFFQEERERLDRWAEDMVKGAEKQLDDTKAQIAAQTRQGRLATTIEEQRAIQVRIRELEQQQRRQRQRIFDVEDEIRERRDELISRLEQRLQQRSSVAPLFTIRWQVR